MTYSIIVGKYKLMFSDTHFKDFRKKPTVSVYDADTNSETKIASFNSQETFEWFIEAVVKADRKTENSSEKPNNCEDCIWTVCNYNKAFKDEPTISKMEQVDEPKTQTETQNSNLTFEKRTMRDCYNCKRYETEGECIECHYEPTDEPQTNADQHIQHVESVEPTWAKENHEAFYTFLWNVINPNEMQDYIGMFETKDEPQERSSDAE